MNSDFNENEKKSTHQKIDFGFQDIPKEEKTAKVAEIFSSVAPYYNLMNDAMSLGMHRLWKRFALAKTGLKPGQHALDVAAGTGDLTRGLLKQVGDNGLVIASDINPNMLAHAKTKLCDEGFLKTIRFVEADAEKLPFDENTFHVATMGFGLRNVTDKKAALASLFRVLKPGGKLLILEFSNCTHPILSKFYDFYSFHCIPKLGALIANDAPSYQYLVESIRRHPNQETLKQWMEEAGFKQVNYFNLSGGIVALHVGYKY